MKLCVATILVCLTVASNLPGAEPEFPLVKAEECRPRAGLPNFLKKASQKGAEARIGYFGGSITAQPGWRVFVTGHGGDGPAVLAMQAAGLDPRVEVLLDMYALREFLGVLSSGDVFLGPSTGPLHLAGALGLGVVGIYPPVPAMSPRRWGPRSRWNRVLVPEVACPGRHACLLERCPLHNCLGEVGVNAAVAAVRAVVGERDGLPTA